MAKKRKGSKNAKTDREGEKGKEDRVTMKALAEMSDDSDNEEIPDSMWNKQAKSLRQAIEDGKFDSVVDAIRSNNNEDEFEEAVLDDEEESDEQSQEDNEEEEHDAEEASEDEEEDSNHGDEEDVENEEDTDEEMEESEPAPADGEEGVKLVVEDDEADSSDDDDDEDSEEEESGKHKQEDSLAAKNVYNAKALAVVTSELVASHSGLPWAETFDIVPATPLPFNDNEDSEDGPVDIHDDLKREVAFYNSALEAVHEARSKCKDAGIPFSRETDFFAEMVKTDDHMAKVKDKLIFETKKMDAVAQRKSNREQKLRAKESHSNKLAEKAKRKRDHFQQVEEWANSAAKNRGGKLEDDADERFMRGPNKKRQSADRKYGFGGKKGRFKQNDRSTLNDVSGFNPRGNFPGMGTKKTAKSRDGSGANRAGKRARDAHRARK